MAGEESDRMQESIGKDIRRLLKLVALVALVGLFIHYAWGGFRDPPLGPQIDASQLGIRNVGLALKEFELSVGRCPTTEEGLMALLKCPNEGEANCWKGPYLNQEEMPKDAWGHDLHYRSPSIHEKTYDLWSSGPDGIEGNQDDIVNWKRK